MPYQTLALCLRFRISISELRTVYEAQWNLVSHAAIVYLLFPNAVLVIALDHLETWHMFPSSNGADETRMYVSLYTPKPALTESASGIGTTISIY